MENFEHTFQKNEKKSLLEDEQSIKKNSQQDEGHQSPSVRGIIKGYKEKITAFLRYKKLKTKEYSDKLTQDEFNELLLHDFHDQLRDNPPIRELFSAERELIKIKKSPKGEKKKLLSAFKENLVRQREAWANCRVFIERSIEFNHDIPQQYLVILVENFGKEYGFTQGQKLIAKHFIDGYYENRRKVLETREHFPEDIALIKKLTGVTFSKTDKIDVSVGPMTIDIDVEGFNAGRIYERADHPVVGFEYGGFASQSIGDNPIYYIVINQDKYIRERHNDPTGAQSRQHEYEHQKNKLFRSIFDHTLSEHEIGSLRLDYRFEHDAEYKKVLLENYFYAAQERALEQAKDEIIACLQDRSLSILQRDIDWLFFQQKGDSYDYLANVRDIEIEKDNPLYQETSQKILVKEYKIIIEKAVGLFAELVDEGGYSIQEAIALLTDTSLSHWPKTIQRLLENKEK